MNLLLSDDQIAFYRDNGYLVVESALGAEDLRVLRGEIERLTERARHVARNDAVYDLEDTHGPSSPRLRRIKEPDKHSAAVAALIRDARILDRVEPLIGPDIRLQSTKLNMKSATYGAAVEWHQDWAFYPYTNDDILAVGVMIDDMDEHNGPLMVIPGSHKGPILDHHQGGFFCGAVAPAAIDMSQAVKLTGPAGSISIHHVRAVHGSDLNRSNRDRRLLLIELMAADAWPLCATGFVWQDLAEHDARMLRGKPTLAPRLAAVPVRIPQPKPATVGSIYEVQKAMSERSFAVYGEAH